MKKIKRIIIPIGGGLMRKGETFYIDKFIVDLVKNKKKASPNVLFIPTASGDLAIYSKVFRETYKELGCKVRILKLLNNNKKRINQKTIKKNIMESDIIYIGGGDYNLLFSELSRNKIIPILKEAYQKGVILTGLSAGCGIWYQYVIEKGKHNNFCLNRGMGLLPGAVFPHYQPGIYIPVSIRRKARKILGIQDQCALIYINGKLKGSISAEKTLAFNISSSKSRKKVIRSFLFSESKKQITAQPIRFWSNKVLRVLKKYNEDQSLILFGVTGDIDNLGLFVAQNGRPMAENLVDVYNHLVGSFIYRYVENSKNISHFCLIPSGEEIFAIGLAHNASVVKRFFSLLNKDINLFIKKNEPFTAQEVSISFGCKILSHKTIKPLISKLIKLVEQKRIKKASLVYLKLMLILRRILAYELDCVKFESLDIAGSDLIIFFRNLVYTKLKSYKEETRKTLLKVASKCNSDYEYRKCFKSSLLNKKYGVTDQDCNEIEKLLKLLQKKI